MTLVFLALIALVVFGIPLVARPLVKRAAAARERQLGCVTRFYELAPKLIADDRIPDSIAETLWGISESIDHRRVVWSLLRAWIYGRLGGNLETQAQVMFDATVRNLPDDLRDRVGTAFACALIAVTYSAPFPGAVLRRLLFSTVGMPQRTDDAAIFAYQAVCHSAA